MFHLKFTLPLQKRFIIICTRVYKFKWTNQTTPGGRGSTQITVWWGVQSEVWKPLSISKDLLPHKTADLTVFKEIFANWDPFLRVFLPQKMSDFTIFFGNSWEMGPLLSPLFLPNWDSSPRICREKVTKFGRHIPLHLCDWVINNTQQTL